MHSITIGGFDGVHTGHQELIKKADIVLVIEKGSSLTPGFERLFYINKKTDFLILEEIKHLKAIEFINILKKYNASKIIVGEDFKFGKNRSGDINMLKKHFEVEVIREIKIDGIGVHSQIIREFIKKGEIKKANKFLGRNYKIRGLHIKGQGLGKKEFVPTINIELLKPFTLPKPAVYLTKTNSSPSVTFIGIRSTDNSFSIETHILNSEHVPNSNIIDIEFIKILRENMTFKDLGELKKRILTDISTAFNFFRQ